MTDTQKKSGIVAGINQRQGKYGFTFEEEKSVWYNGKGDCPCKKGDKIDLTYVINGQWKNVQQIYKSEQPPVNTQPAQGYFEITKIEVFQGLTLQNLKFELNKFNEQHKVIATQTHPVNGSYDAIVYYK